MDEIDWTKRLIGIKGSRGVGKTTFLLQYAKDHFAPGDRSCLYINFNNFYFSVHTLSEFAGEFYRNGGRTLLLDQTFKYENWSKELRYCYDNFPELQIIFSGSPVMRLVEDNTDLQDVVVSYNLRGFSFREYLNLKSNNSFPAYTLQQIVDNHQQIAADICKSVNANIKSKTPIMANPITYFFFITFPFYLLCFKIKFPISITQSSLCG